LALPALGGKGQARSAQLAASVGRPLLLNAPPPDAADGFQLHQRQLGGVGRDAEVRPALDAPQLGSPGAQLGRVLVVEPLEGAGRAVAVVLELLGWAFGRALLPPFFKLLRFIEPFAEEV